MKKLLLILLASTSVANAMSTKYLGHVEDTQVYELCIDGDTYIMTQDKTPSGVYTTSTMQKVSGICSNGLI